MEDVFPPTPDPRSFPSTPLRRRAEPDEAAGWLRTPPPWGGGCARALTPNMPVWQLVLAIALAYLWGSIPSSYIAVRLIKGIDLRQYGTGNIGVSNAVMQAGKWVGVPLVIFDVLVKGTLPVFLASGVVFDLGTSTQVAIGLAAIVGHNWSIYIKLQGGRGLAPALGVLLALHWPLLLAYSAVALAVWTPTRNSPVAWFVAALSLPVLVVVMRLPAEMLAFAFAYAAIILVRRALGNWPGRQPPRPRELSATRVLINRL
ncbi:MAG: glycerol-3-phosphate acyltransferase, partial [Chloroflexi bacterium]|nr:glycerol-3-phosphate acyltransferase [Chloroflexota bacterium]